MSNDSLPLYYAIIKHFENETEDCAQGVVTALEPEYSGYKLLTLNDVAEALATAKENGILKETHMRSTAICSLLPTTDSPNSENT